MKRFIHYLTENALTESHIQSFIDFASNHLGLKDKPKVDLVHERDGTMTTASYCPETKSVKVYAKGRAAFDVCRSIAHELVHADQQEKGEYLDGETGSACENHANSMAGQIVRLYGKQNPDFYE